MDGLATCLWELISQNPDLYFQSAWEVIVHVSLVENEVEMLVAQLPVGLDEHVERNDESYYRMFWEMNVLNLEEAGMVSGVSNLTNLGQ